MNYHVHKMIKIYHKHKILNVKIKSIKIKIKNVNKHNNLLYKIIKILY